MPELPEVETTVRGIRKLTGKKISDVWTDYNSPFYKGKSEIKNPAYFKDFREAIIGTFIAGAERRAKNILIHLSPADKKSEQQTILIHMKMTGHILHGKYQLDAKKKADQWTAVEDGPLKDPFNRFIHFMITFSDGTHLALSDMRKFAKVTLIKTADIETSLHTSGLGPEPLARSFDLKLFKTRLSLRPKAPIKSILMDQSLISGIGNIYSDEILWRAGVHPESHFGKIPAKNISLMFTAMKETLKKGIDFGGDSMSDYRNLDGERGKFQEHHEAYRRTKLPCRKRGCKGIISRKVIGGRSAHFCETHQKLFI